MPKSNYLLVKVVSLSLFCLVQGACDRGENKSSTVPTATTTTATSAALEAFKIPQVGIQPVPREMYKPVVGKYGGQLVRDTLGEPKSFNPITSGETSTSDYTDRIFEGLTTEDPWTGEVKPFLAESWETSPDGLTWAFKLRKDVKFNDGQPFTAADVVFTWNDLIYDSNRPAGTDPRWPSSMRDVATFGGKQAKAEAVDEYTVKFTLPAKVAIWDQFVGTGVLPKHKYAAAVADGSFGSALGSDSKTADIVGTGPFMLDEYRRGEKVTLKRNPNYWKKDSSGQSLPYLDRLVFVVVRDLNAMLLDFQQGVTDTFSMRHGKDVREFKPKQESGNFKLYQLGPPGGAEFLCFNMNEDAAKKKIVADYKVKWFRDTRFRQAVAYAMDKESLVRNVLTNLGYPLGAHYTLTPGFYQYPEFQPYPHNIEKAKALLADMGLKDRNGDGVLEDEAGHKVTFTINTNSENNLRVEAASFIARDLKNIGMEVNTLPLSFNLLVQKTDVGFDWECLYFGLTGGRDPQWTPNWSKSSGRLHLWWPDQKTPSFDWEKRSDEIFDTAASELDKNKRKELYREWVGILHREQPFIYATAPERVVAIRNKFGNLFPTPSPGRNTAVFHNEEEIFVLDASAAAGR